jgi:hypothetical protein
MDLSESADPKDWHRIMERFFAELPPLRIFGTAALAGHDGYERSRAIAAEAGRVAVLATAVRALHDRRGRRAEGMIAPAEQAGPRARPR